MTISELCEKVDKRLNGRNPMKYRLDMLVPDEELKKYKDREILICAVHKNLMIPMCCICTAPRPNGKWIPPSDYTKLLKNTYRPISYTYCPDCMKSLAEQEGINFTALGLDK